MIHHLISYIITPSTNSMCGLSPLSCFSSWKWLKISVGEFNKPQLFKVQLLIQQHMQVFVVCFSKASVEAAHKKWNYQEVCGVVDEKQDKPDSSKLQHVQCTRCHSQTSAREQAPFIQTPQKPPVYGSVYMIGCILGEWLRLLAAECCSRLYEEDECKHQHVPFA